MKGGGAIARLPVLRLQYRKEKNRLEAFSDAVLAIIIMVMVLEMKVPHGSDLAALKPLLPVLLTYLLSFIYLGNVTHTRPPHCTRGG